ncbi:MAG TPA: PadR family transcriptional regulator [Acidimicrobiales bacterium]|nr:PadR family transcriptional regulator [Acidimicrobiales bacterium]
MPRPRRSNPLALAVLVSLYERPMHPYEIAQTLRSRAKQESVRLNYGSLYRVVDSLERAGLVRARDTVREGRRPERTTYEITDAGAREATDWLTELLAVPRKEYPQFMAGLSFLPALPPGEVTSILRDRARALEMRLVLHRGALGAARAAGLPRLFALEGEYDIALCEAEHLFVLDVLADLESGSLDGLEMWRSFHDTTGDRADPAPGLVTAHTTDSADSADLTDSTDSADGASPVARRRTASPEIPPPPDMAKEHDDPTHRGTRPAKAVREDHRARRDRPRSP